MAKKSVKFRVSEVDPLFFIPDGVDELTYTDDFDSLNFGDGQGFNTDGTEINADEFEVIYDPEEDPSDLDTPEILGIISQELTRGHISGATTVKVVFQTTPLVGKETFEIRVSPL